MKTTTLILTLLLAILSYSTNSYAKVFYIELSGDRVCRETEFNSNSLNEEIKESKKIFGADLTIISNPVYNEKFGGELAFIDTDNVETTGLVSLFDGTLEQCNVLADSYKEITNEIHQLKEEEANEAKKVNDKPRPLSKDMVWKNLRAVIDTDADKYYWLGYKKGSGGEYGDTKPVLMFGKVIYTILTIFEKPQSLNGVMVQSRIDTFGLFCSEKMATVLSQELLGENNESVFIKRFPVEKNPYVVGSDVAYAASAYCD